MDYQNEYWSLQQLLLFLLKQLDLRGNLQIPVEIQNMALLACKY